jgi:hypothetical protein
MVKFSLALCVFSQNKTQPMSIDDSPTTPARQKGPNYQEFIPETPVSQQGRNQENQQMLPLPDLLVSTLKFSRH